VIIKKESGNACIKALILPQANGKKCEYKLSIIVCRGKNYDLICSVHGAPLLSLHGGGTYTTMFLKVLHTQAKF
jgi:hypothetical protein